MEARHLVDPVAIALWASRIGVSALQVEGVRLIAIAVILGIADAHMRTHAETCLADSQNCLQAGALEDKVLVRY
ncbi:hypothetical protein [Ferrimicrobium acidiphilum]|uniref:hypothetical protein n=1 Tax=Ferrimicrobium acidiphilum TaxID=121039 RepID=UPI0023F32A23|nr:hypothetical protein [Ferrimicrobium acidiphilum]